MPVTAATWFSGRSAKYCRTRTSRCRAGSDCSADTRPDGPGRRPGGTARDRSITRRRSRDSAAPRSGWSRGPGQADCRATNASCTMSSAVARSGTSTRPAGPVTGSEAGRDLPLRGQRRLARTVSTRSARSSPIRPPAPRRHHYRASCMAAASMRSGIRRGQRREAARLTPASRPAHPGGRPPSPSGHAHSSLHSFSAPLPSQQHQPPGTAEPQRCDIDAVRTATM